MAIFRVSISSASLRLLVLVDLRATCTGETALSSNSLRMASAWRHGSAGDTPNTVNHASIVARNRSLGKAREALSVGMWGTLQPSSTVHASALEHLSCQSVYQTIAGRIVVAIWIVAQSQASHCSVCESLALRFIAGQVPRRELPVSLASARVLIVVMLDVELLVVGDTA